MELYGGYLLRLLENINKVLEGGKMRLLGVFLVVLGFFVMFYSGFLQAINYWGVDNVMVVWG